MTKRTRDLAKRGTGGVTGGSGQVTRLAGLVVPARTGSLVHRVVPPHRRPAQAGEQSRPAGSLTLLNRAGAAISSPPAGAADPARAQGREAPAPPPGAAGGAGNSAQRPR